MCLFSLDHSVDLKFDQLQLIQLNFLRIDGEGIVVIGMNHGWKL